MRRGWVGEGGWWGWPHGAGGRGAELQGGRVGGVVCQVTRSVRPGRRPLPGTLRRGRAVGWTRSA
jgi:hypothetical protein